MSKKTKMQASKVANDTFRCTISWNQSRLKPGLDNSSSRGTKERKIKFTRRWGECPAWSTNHEEGGEWEWDEWKCTPDIWKLSPRYHLHRFQQKKFDKFSRSPGMLKIMIDVLTSVTLRIVRLRSSLCMNVRCHSSLCHAPKETIEKIQSLKSSLKYGKGSEKEAWDPSINTR